MTMRTIEVFDTTLRDGEQFHGGLYMPEQKLHIARMLLEAVRVDRIEIASARVQPEHATVRTVLDWATAHGYAERVEVLGFVDGARSIDWITSAGGRVINLLVKGSERHCQVHLRKTLSEHIRDVTQTVRAAAERGMMVNVYLEDWSQGMRHSPSYVRTLTSALRELPITRLMLADTLGVLQPGEVRAMVSDMATWWDRHLDFHGHNDYGLATANVLAAVEAGAHGVHVTVNGTGERAGNAPLDEVVAVLHDHAHVQTGVVEHALRGIAQIVAQYTERPIPANKPISGVDVFVGTAGIHADGDLKGGLYVSQLDPQRFGVEGAHALGKLSGRASIRSNLLRFGISVTDEELDAITARVVETGARKRHMTTAEFLDIVISVVRTLQFATLVVSELEIRGPIHTERTDGDTVVRGRITIRDRSDVFEGRGASGFDAFCAGFRSWIGRNDPSVCFPTFVAMDTQSAVRNDRPGVIATVTWRRGEGSTFTTNGFGVDQTFAAIGASVDAVNIMNPSARVSIP